MGTIFLEKGERYFLNNKFYLIKKGKISSKDILENGRIIANEDFLRTGEIIGNFFNFLPKKRITFPEIEIEIEAVENSVILEEIKFPSGNSLSNGYLEKMLECLIKKAAIKFFYQLYDTKGYILAILKLYLNGNEFIKKEEIRYENFNISKSQFYLIFSALKKERFVLTINRKVFLDEKKIDSYLISLSTGTL